MTQPDLGFTSKAVQHTPELVRVMSIPRRKPEDFPTWVVERMTSILKTPHGTMTLKHVQAMALLEIGMYGGLFGPIRVGAGKTLISLLASTVMRAWRPLLLIPASLAQKTQDDIRFYSKHFKIPRFIRIESYSLLGKAQHSNLLNQYRPDLIIADECHKLRNKRTAVTRRMIRFMRYNPGTRFVAMSGTVTKRSLQDFEHILKWSHKDFAPVPFPVGEVLEWAAALDEKIAPGRRTAPGALLQLCGPEDLGNDALTNARSGFKRRLIQTPGIVATQEKKLDIELSINSVSCDLNSDIDRAFSTLRDDWLTPDGWHLWDAFEIARHARTLALGFYYRWNPRPPEDWYEARKAWAKACREIIGNSKNLDSMQQVVLSIKRGETSCTELDPWQEIEPSFTPNTEAVWIDDSVVRFAADWAKQSIGVVWTTHTAFATALTNLSRMPYFASEGLCTRTKLPISSEDGTRSIISSLNSNRQGQNLQQFNRGLVVCPPSNGEWWQQLLGRHHRPGQTKPVTFDLLQVCLEHVTALNQAIKDSHFAQQITGDAFKLCHAEINDISIDEAIEMQGPRWGSNG